MSQSLPEYVVPVHAYKVLGSYARAFAEGHLSLLIVCGPPGQGKSRTIRRALGQEGCWVDGNASAFWIYQKAYEHRNEAIVLDDVDSLYREPAGRRLLKTLCQTEPVKSLAWLTDAGTLKRRGIPRQFTTRSRVCLIANRWQSLNADVTALEDRAHFLCFTPSPLEVHKQAARWYSDQEIYDFVAAHLHLIERHSLRTYVLGAELKRAGLDWKQ